jgi:hypothetical protein
MAGPKSLDFQGPPLPMALIMVMDVATCPHQNNYVQRHIINSYINSYFCTCSKISSPYSFVVVVGSGKDKNQELE